MIQTLDRTGRPLLALSLVLFAVAGASNTTLDTGLHSVVAVTLVVAGCYCLARFANQVSRKRLVALSIAFWIAFLAVSTLHVFDTSTFVTSVPLSFGVATTVLEALTWATLLGAAVSTAFVGFREYGSGATTDSPDELLDGDVEY